MHYVEQSLAPHEKVVMIGRFHWIYVAGGVFWIIFGFLGAALILGVGIAFDVWRTVSAQYAGLPVSLITQAWGQVLAQKGGIWSALVAAHIAIRLLALGSVLFGLLLFAHKMIIRATTEIAVTTSRLVLKEGVIARNVDEMNIDRIESVHVTQTILGRILGYGVVMVRGMGIGEIILPTVANPVLFRRAIEKAKQINETMKP